MNIQSKKEQNSIKKLRRIIIFGIVFFGVIYGSTFILINSIKEPQVTVKSLDLKGIEDVNLMSVPVPATITFSIILEVDNPNSIGAKLTDLKYDIFINDVHVGKGYLTKEISIIANRKNDVETDIDISTISVIRSIINTLQKNSAIAKVKGTAHIEIIPVLGGVDIPFEREMKLS